MAWNAGVIVLTALAVLIGLRSAVRFVIQHEMDSILVEDVFEIEFALADAGATPEALRRAAFDPWSDSTLRVLLDEFNGKARGHAGHGWFAVLRSPDGELLWSSESAPTPAPAIVESPDFAPQERPGQRLVQSRRTSGRYSPLFVQVGMSTGSLDRDMARIDALALLAAGVVLITAAPVGYWLAGRAIRPLAEMIEATSRYRPEELRDRLELRGTGDELDQLGRTVNGLLDRLAAYLSHQRDLLANSAHELRTPLAAIRAAVEVALDGRRSREESEELLGGVLEQCAGLETLVNQLLLLAEAEGERLKLRGGRCDLSALVQQACQIFQAVAESREIGWSCRIAAGLEAPGSASHWRQVVNNLIDNALKFTPSGGRVETILRRTADGAVVLEVRDDGPGVAAADLPRIFERFYRVDRARTHGDSPGGTGLGLSICRAVVEAYGGTIECESRPEQGAVFRVVLPAGSESRSAVERG